MELFSIGFLNITIPDVIDILLVTFIFYRLYRAMRGTIAAQIFIGLILVVTLSFVAQATNLKAVSWLLRTVSDIWVIAFIIIFQPEIRRLLSNIALNRFVRKFLRFSVTDTIDDIINASLDLSRKRYGALIVISRGTGMKSFTENGITLNAQMSKSLLLSIFNPRSPLHDGAVIVNDQTIEAARCTLPLSAHTTYGDLQLGTRHRAALGISEQTDAICVIVSEETGAVSITENGELYYRLSTQELRKELHERLITSVQRSLKNAKKAMRKK
ncbi:MAG: TIGR00159 family protein [Bacteroidetes bacterium]|nr:TIGR00159 family protein [Bacteroidota bacterium]